MGIVLDLRTCPDYDLGPRQEIVCINVRLMSLVTGGPPVFPYDDIAIYIGGLLMFLMHGDWHNGLSSEIVAVDVNVEYSFGAVLLPDYHVLARTKTVAGTWAFDQDSLFSGRQITPVNIGPAFGPSTIGPDHHAPADDWETSLATVFA